MQPLPGGLPRAGRNASTKTTTTLVTRYLCVPLILALLAPMAAALGPASHDASPSPFVVAFDSHAALPARGAAFLGGHVISSNADAGYIVVSSPHASDMAIAATLAHVRYAEPDVQLHALGFTPNDPQWSSTYQYGPRQIGATEVWNTTLGSSSVVICIVDSGMRLTHEDLASSYVGGKDFTQGLAQPIDDMGHGTNVAGVAAAATNNAIGMAGVAHVGIRVAKVMTSSGSAAGSAVTDGIRWCADTGSDVISMSLGTTGFSQLLSDTIDYAWAHGSVLVAAAGNSGPCTNCVEYPAKFANVLAVGCFVSWYDRCPASSSGPELDLMAPGDKLLTTDYATDNGYVVRSGTSLAAPMVAGVAALMRSLNPTMSNQQIDDLLRSTAQDYGTAGFDQSFGYGLVRADRAAQQVGTPAPPPPQPPAQPDLRVASVQLSNAAPVAGSVIWANATVSNIGTASAGAFRARLLVDSVETASTSMSGLAAGANTGVSFAWTSVAGSHTLAIEADPDHVVAESVETNNAASATASVTSPSPPPAQPVYGVDLTPATQSGSMKAHQSKTFTLQVKNTGNTADRVYIALGALPSGWTASVSTTSIDLGAGQSQSFQVTITAAKAPRGSSMTLQVTVSSAADPSKVDAGSITATVA